jgi:hypothetical protein
MPEDKHDPLPRRQPRQPRLVLVEDSSYVAIAALLAVGSLVLVGRAGIELVDGRAEEGRRGADRHVRRDPAHLHLRRAALRGAITLKERQIVA